MMAIKNEIYKECQISIVCPSQYLLTMTQQSILRHFPSRLIYNGIDTSVFKPEDRVQARKNLSLPLEKKIVMFAADNGLKNGWKGGYYVKRICEHYLNKCAKDILFLNIGCDFSSNSNMLRNIPYIHDKETLSLYYSASDVFLYPSLADNCTGCSGVSRLWYARGNI